MNLYKKESFWSFYQIPENEKSYNGKTIAQWEREYQNATTLEKVSYNYRKAIVKAKLNEKYNLGFFIRKLKFPLLIITTLGIKELYLFIKG